MVSLIRVVWHGAKEDKKDVSNTRFASSRTGCICLLVHTLRLSMLKTLIRFKWSAVTSHCPSALTVMDVIVPIWRLLLLLLSSRCSLNSQRTSKSPLSHLETEQTSIRESTVAIMSLSEPGVNIKWWAPIGSSVSMYAASTCWSRDCFFTLSWPGLCGYEQRFN